MDIFGRVYSLRHVCSYLVSFPFVHASLHMCAWAGDSGVGRRAAPPL